jgi:hypothetical protein
MALQTQCLRFVSKLRLCQYLTRLLSRSCVGIWGIVRCMIIMLYMRVVAVFLMLKQQTPLSGRRLLLFFVLAPARSRRRWPCSRQRRQGPVRLWRWGWLPGRVWSACRFWSVGGWGSQSRIVLGTDECVYANRLSGARAGRSLGSQGGGFQALLGRFESFFELFEFGGLGVDNALSAIC